MGNSVCKKTVCKIIDRGSTTAGLGNFSFFEIHRIFYLSPRWAVFSVTKRPEFENENRSISAEIVWNFNFTSGSRFYDAVIRQMNYFNST